MSKWAPCPKECEINGLSRFLLKHYPSFYFCHTYPLTETWDPPFRCFSLCSFGRCVDNENLPLESQNPEIRLVPNNYCPSTFSGIFSFPLQDFVNQEFETLNSKVTSSSTSRTPKKRNAKIPHQRHTEF
jgi:hypothetical protein